MKFRSYITVLLFLSFVACETEAALTYNITNNASFPVTVIRTRADGQLFTDTFKIAPNSQITIAENGEGLDVVSTYKEVLDTLRRFPMINIYKNDTQKAKTDFRKTSRWTYNEKSKHQADYLLTVTESDF